MRWDKRRWARSIFWALVLASVVVTADTVRKVVGDDRSSRGLELSRVNLDGPLHVDQPITGRALFVNHSGATIWMERAGETHFWLDLTASSPVQIAADAQTRFFPCGAAESETAAEVVPGPAWWCFRQGWPLLDRQELDEIRKASDRRLWFATLVTYRIGEGKIRHARLCQVYNYEADRFERSRRESCDWFE
jgi:hypothetical protein